MSMSHTQYVITFSCPDKLGVMAKFSSLFYESGAFITGTAQFSDPETEQFFQRCVFDDRCLKLPYQDFRQAIAHLASEIDMQYQLRPVNQKPRVLLGVSRYDHCLTNLLNKWKSGALDIDITGVFSNHEDCRSLVEWHGLNYYYLPVTPATKPQQEQQLLELMSEHQVDLLVLARYMQVLSDQLCETVAGKAINIHHSFLPGFKGAKPYHQAYQRGVKKIGATAHYVTADLDEGPIIVQEVKAIDHSVSVEDMVHMGRDIESSTLAHAVKLYSEQRTLLNGQRTVIL
jgi:formyltetrahydrofolate deformylase